MNQMQLYHQAGAGLGAWPGNQMLLQPIMMPHPHHPDPAGPGLPFGGGLQPCAVYYMPVSDYFPMQHHRRDGPIRPKPNPYKTVICRNYMTYGMCRFGVSCVYAHGEDELRRPHYDVLCKYADTCPYGDRCQYRHVGQDDDDDDGGKSGVPLPPLTRVEGEEGQGKPSPTTTSTADLVRPGSDILPGKPFPEGHGWSGYSHRDV